MADLTDSPPAISEVPSTSPAPMINVVDPDTQEIGSIPQEQLSTALSQGYTQATPDQTQSFLHHQKYSNQMGEAAIEGFGEGMAGPLSTGAERLAGVPGEDILARREANPVTHFLSQTAGLGLGLLTGTGEAKLLGEAGNLGVHALGLGAEGAGLASKVGSAAVRGAIEGGLFQSLDEGTKAIAGDPNQTVPSALTNIGLYGMLGGAGIGAAFGVPGALWESTVGPKVAKGLQTMDQGLGSAMSDPISEAAAQSGVTLAPEIHASISENPVAQNMFQALAQSDTTSGEALQKTLGDFRTQLSDQIPEAFQKTPEQISALSDLSPFEAGKNIQDTLQKEFQEKALPLSNEFESIKEQFKNAPLTPEIQQSLSEKLGQFSLDQGLEKAPSSPQNHFMQNIMKELPLQQTAEDLRKYASTIGANTYNSPLSYLGGAVKRMLNEAEENAIGSAFAEKAPDQMARLAQAKAAYREVMGTADSLADRLHPGKYFGPASFARSIGEMEKPEQLLSRIASPKDVNLQNLLEEKFPQTAAAVKDYQLSQLLKTSTKDGAIVPERFFRSVEKLSPEMRKALIPQEIAPKLGGIQTLMKAIDSIPRNTSNTAPILNAMQKYGFGSAVGMVSMLLGHNPITAALIGGMTKIMGQDIPDAVRLALLKRMGSSAPTSAGGFKAMTQMISETMKGTNLVGKATKALFQAGKDVLPASLVPDQKIKDKLDEKVKDLQKNPHAMLDIGGQVGHYMPEHAQAMGQMAAQTTNYLNSQRPGTVQNSPLDRKMEPSKQASNAYQRTLGIAEQPLMPLQYLKDGELQAKDVQDLNAMYPSFYQHLKQKVSDEMMNHLTDESKIPYSKRMSLSLFLGQPLDSTLTPQGIMAAQSTFQQNASPTQPAPKARGGGAHSMKALQNISELDQLPSQSRQMQRNRQT